MAKERSNKRGFVFEDKIDLSQWEFNHLDYAYEEAFYDFEEAVQKSIEKERKKLTRRLGSAEKKIRKIASEALQITFEENILACFWQIHEKPEILNLFFHDFAMDGYMVGIDLKKAIKDCLLENCAADGYIYEQNEKMMLKFSDMLKELENEVRTAIRPKED